MSTKKVPAENNRPGFTSLATGGHVALHRPGFHSDQEIKIPVSADNKPAVEETQEQAMEEEDLQAFAATSSVEAESEPEDEEESEEEMADETRGLAKASPKFEEVEEEKAHASEADKASAIEANTVTKNKQEDSESE
jgi:TATA-binding protein-associated factor Taf7